MSIFDTNLIDSAAGVLKNFSYGHHPSIVMWSNGVVDQKEDDDSFLGSITGGISRALESIPLVGDSLPESFSSFKFDAMVSEEHEAASTVTKFPVSSGFLVSDHVINQNRVLKLTAVAVNMQNSSMWSASLQGLSVATGAIFNSPALSVMGSAIGAVASTFETSNRIQSTYDLFNSFRTTGKKLYISTILGPYLNCVVTSIKAKHDKNTSAMLAVEILLEELQTIGTDALAVEARKAMESMYDYSDFAKTATNLGMGALGGVPLPGLGDVFGVSSVTQLANLKGKLELLNSPVSSVKGVLL